MPPWFVLKMFIIMKRICMYVCLFLYFYTILIENCLVLEFFVAELCFCISFVVIQKFRQLIFYSWQGFRLYRKFSEGFPLYATGEIVGSQAVCVFVVFGDIFIMNNILLFWFRLALTWVNIWPSQTFVWGLKFIALCQG